MKQLLLISMIIVKIGGQITNRLEWIIQIE